MRRKTEIFSIFGQIEAVVAEGMIEQYGLHRIDAKDIPETAAFNEAGQTARFAVVIPAERRTEFERRITELRA
jgi:hypothetical protein